MPNWVYNVVDFEDCTEEEFSKIAEEISVFNEVDAKKEVSFGKLIPMPKEIEETGGEYVSNDMAIEMYYSYLFMSEEVEGVEKIELSEVDARTKTKGGLDLDLLTLGSDFCRSRAEIRARIPKWSTVGQVLNYGKRLFENLLNYGAKDWYDWSIANWGCKWDASESCIVPLAKKIIFQTPWNCPVPVLVALSEKFPEKRIVAMYADEDYGHNCGIIELKGGRLVGEIGEKGFGDPYEFALNVWEW